MILSDEQSDTAVQRLTRMVIAGNCLDPSVHERDYLSKAKYLTKKAAVPTVEPMVAFDLQLAQLTVCLKTLDYMLILHNHLGVNGCRSYAW